VTEPNKGISNNIVFHGSLSSLNASVKNGSVKTALQASHTRPCKFWSAVRILSGIKNSVIITHGASGCAYGVKLADKLFNCRNSGMGYEPVLTTRMNLSGVIFGGENELSNAIKEVEYKYSPDVIFIATCCVSGVIGDNVDGVVDQMRGSVKARILTIHCEGFSGESRSGFDLVFKELVHLMDPSTAISRNRLSSYVNIIGAKRGPEKTETETDLKELVRMIQNIGGHINGIIAGNCSLSELQQAPSASLNTAFCIDIGYVLGKEMNRVFGTPCSAGILPYGIAASKTLLLEIAELLGTRDKANKYLEQEYDSIKYEFEPIKKRLNGKTAIIVGGSVRAFSIAHMLEKDFDMHAVIFNFHPWNASEHQTSIEQLLKTGVDPEILITQGTLAFGKYQSMKQTEEELLNVVNSSNPESVIYFGAPASFPNIPSVNLNATHCYPKFGVRGALKVAQKIQTTLDYSSLERSWLSKKIALGEGAVTNDSFTNIPCECQNRYSECLAK
jgi:nitrogenase vanadium-cofactor synthesis protein VnfE